MPEPTLVREWSRVLRLALARILADLEARDAVNSDDVLEALTQRLKNGYENIRNASRFFPSPHPNPEPEPKDKPAPDPCKPARSNPEENKTEQAKPESEPKHDPKQEEQAKQQPAHKPKQEV